MKCIDVLMKEHQKILQVMKKVESKEDNVLYAMARNIDINVNGGDEYMMTIFENVKLSDANLLHVSKF